jgi:hypothetical protein
VTAPVAELGPLGLDRGGHLLVRRALRAVPAGEVVLVRGSHPDLELHLRAWCRAGGHQVEAVNGELRVRAGGASRLAGAARAGGPGPDGVVDRPAAAWGLAARGALVEAGGPAPAFRLDRKEEVWSDDAPRLYAEAVAAQWDPATAIDWSAPVDLPDEVEDAVVQLLTYLVENEQAALVVPARFLGQVHPHFREVQQLLAVQTADEARHLEVFSRRARLRRGALGLSTVGGQASLVTLLDEPDFGQASFLLGVLGEGSFLSLLAFVAERAPDPITARVAALAAKDEARHVAFALSHLRRAIGLDPRLRGRLAGAVERRHAALQHTAGLNAEVFDALLLLAAGGWEPTALARGHDQVVALVAEMDRARRHRLKLLGFGEAEAQALSALHTRNFM